MAACFPRSVPRCLKGPHSNWNDNYGYGTSLRYGGGPVSASRHQGHPDGGHQDVSWYFQRCVLWGISGQGGFTLGMHTKWDKKGRGGYRKATSADGVSLEIHNQTVFTFHAIFWLLPRLFFSGFEKISQMPRRIEPPLLQYWGWNIMRRWEYAFKKGCACQIVTHSCFPLSCVHG